jgi:hypothetical protein
MKIKHTLTKTLALAALLALMSPDASVYPNGRAGTNAPRFQTATRARVCNAAQMAGADIGAKINACDATLGPAGGEIVLTGGGNIATNVVISSYHTLRVASGVYTATVHNIPIRLKDNASVVCDNWDAVLQESTGAFINNSPMTIIAAFNGSGVEPGAGNGENNANNISVRGCHFRGKPDLVTTASIKAGSSTVTVASPVMSELLTGAQTQHRIIITGAGAAGGLFNAQLMTTPTKTTATLDKTAGTTVTNAPARIKYFGSAYLTLNLGACQNCEASNNWFDTTHSIATGIGGGSNYGKFSKNVTIKDNLFSDVHFVSIAVTNAVNSAVLNNRIVRPGQDGGSATVPIDVEPNIGDRISGLVIDGNIIDTTESGLNVETNSQRVAHGIVIQNGNNNTRPGKIFENVVVSNNRVIGAKLSLSGYRLVSGAGILVREANGVTVKNNYVQSTNHCVRVDFASTSNTVVGNQCNSTGSGSTPAIEIADSGGNRISGNTMYADPADKFGASTNALLIAETGRSNGNVIDANPGAVVSRARR